MPSKVTLMLPGGGGILMVNVALATELSAMPDLNARALRVVVFVRESGAAYAGEAAVGSVPLVV
jgi:hypothetical protein